MPLVFHAPETKFRCKLECAQCAAIKKDRSQCKRRTRKQLPYCFEHTRDLLNINIGPSNIPGAELGLFALKEFMPGEIITPYHGNLIDKAEKDRRYGDGLAPYVVEINKNTYIDSACSRGTGSFMNTNPGHNNARFSVFSGREGHPPSATIRATKRIRVGDEIYVDYGVDTPKFLPPKPRRKPAVKKATAASKSSS